MTVMATGQMQVAGEKDEAKTDRPVLVNGHEYRAEVWPGFPWVPIGDTIVVAPAPEGAEKDDERGIWVVTGVTGGEKKRRGMVIAVGPGSFQPFVGWVSPSEHEDIHIRDVVTWNQESGVEWTVDGFTYLQLQANDIRARMKDVLGLRLRTRLVEDIVKRMAYHKSLGRDAGNMSLANSDPGVYDPNMEEKIGEATERLRDKRGTATKAQIVVPGLKE